MKAFWILATIASLASVTASCSSQNSKDASQAQVQGAKTAVSVDVATVKLEVLDAETEYVGTTAPIREVSVRSRLEGRLIDLNVDVGDRVEVGQIIGNLDDAILSATLLQAEAEVAARASEVSQASAAVGNARAQVERARLQYQQSQADANRFTKLAKEGAVSPQAAENAVTQARTAEQSLRSTEQQVSLQENAVEASSQRVLAQEAIKLREQERQSYTIITAPIAGVVLERVTEIGSLLFAGNEVLKLGDFSQIKVIVQISELEISKIRLNQSVDIGFDSFPNQKFTGIIKRISPVADPLARQIPVEIVVPNRDNRLGSGQLARVQFSAKKSQQIIIAETALETSGRSPQPPKNANNSNPKENTTAKTGARGNKNDKNDKNEKVKPKTATVFVVTGDRDQPKVVARQVTIGDRRDGKVIVLTGLQEGDRVVVRSGGKLQDGDSIKISVLSEPSK
jgi:multidrug efflux pump subunit AcrA (membrane-fusion protein)